MTGDKVYTLQSGSAGYANKDVACMKSALKEITVSENFID